MIYPIVHSFNLEKNILQEPGANGSQNTVSNNLIGFQDSTLFLIGHLSFGHLSKFSSTQDLKEKSPDSIV